MATALRLEPKAGRRATDTALELLHARTADEFDLFELSWRAADARCALPSSQYGWTRACLAALCQDSAMRILAVERGEELLAAAPLVRKRWHGVQRLFLAGADQLHEPTELMGTAGPALRKLAAAIVAAGSPLVLERIPADSPALAALVCAYRRRGLVAVRTQSPHPYLALDESWLKPLGHLSQDDRLALVDARRLAEQMGQVTVEIHAPDLDELPELLDTAFAVESRRGAGHECEVPASDPHRAVFYRQYAQAACMDGGLRISFLRIGDRVAAMQLAVETAGKYWQLKAAQDARFAACLPGELLLCETIRYAAEAMLDSYEFWGRGEPSLARWTRDKRPCVSLRTYPLGIRGLAALVADLAVAGWRRLRKS